MRTIIIILMLFCVGCSGAKRPQLTDRQIEDRRIADRRIATIEYLYGMRDENEYIKELERIELDQKLGR